MIEVDEEGKRTETWVGRRLELDEITSAVGGVWKIDCTVRVGSKVYSCLVRVDAYHLKRPQNMAASRMCGRMIWGKAVLLIRGEEIA